MISKTKNPIHEYIEDLIDRGVSSYSLLTFEDKLGIAAHMILSNDEDDQINFMAESDNAKFIFYFCQFCISKNFETRMYCEGDTFDEIGKLAVSYYESEIQDIFLDVLLYVTIAYQDDIEIDCYSQRRGE